MLIKDIIDALESAAPRSWQEDYDNTGIQVCDVSQTCTGVLLCVDITPEIVDEAIERHCNLIITHHPLMFRKLNSFQNRNRVETTTVYAIQKGINVYSCHTSIDNAPKIGVSWEMARRLGLTDIMSLTSSGDMPGSGSIGNFTEPVNFDEFINLVKTTFNSPVVRISSLSHAPAKVSRVAMCGGAGSEFITDAIRQRADIYITSDCKLNYFLDYAGAILLVDIGHFEAEECTKDIFYQIITEKFPNFAVYKSSKEKNPIQYL